MTDYAHEVHHPRWGSNLESQLSADVIERYNGDGYKTSTETYKGFLGGEKTREKKEYVGYVSREARGDDETALRSFRHRCGLLRIVMTPDHRGKHAFAAILDGHVVSVAPSNGVEFRLSPDDLKDNDGKPVVEVWFSGRGKRRGPLHDYNVSRIVCIFADKEQMDSYVDLTYRGMPKSITRNGVRYSSTSSGDYRSDDGSILPWLVVAYLLLSPNEQEAFAAVNPEVQTMLGNTAPAPDGMSSNIDTAEVEQTPSDDPNYGDTGSGHSDNSDSGSSSYDSGSSSCDSGGGSSDSGGSCGGD